MAMTMTGECQLGAPRDVVWAKLNDAEVLKSCIPGCEDPREAVGHECRRHREDEGRPGVGALQGRRRLWTTSIRRTATRSRGKVKAALQDSPRAARRSSWSEFRTAEPCSPTMCRGADRRQAGAAWPATDHGSAKKLADEFFKNYEEAVQGKQP